MISVSDNDAAAFLLDVLTDSTSGRSWIRKDWRNSRIVVEA
jgi:hypothetical protein